ncbi:CinA family protein [Leifsonia sp. WHRI 6310E]|uniref:CinA family protein n=1 Tax=Leifsonia sp. WHRI 6310E TaxID=3162562 RepID=UPI0035A873A1
MPLPDAGRSGDATARLIARLRETGRTIAAAESLTGGELTAELTRVPGASAVVVGGAVVYATALKHSLLGVDAALLDAEGPVHPQVAAQLAEGVRSRLAVDERAVDVGVATTGVAGPDPQGGRAVGTVYLGIATAAGTRVVELALQGDRAAIRRATVERAIAELVAETGA